ncbi:MAG TPA: shikimate dehydrogenase [Phycisphaerae bacterium]|nr:shikimate dehydrogenase [Phycisphaerae bacterium]
MCSSTHIVVPIVSAAVPLADQVRAAQAAGADVVELRVDRIGDVAAVEALLAQSRSVPLIITVRSAAEGGAWTGGEDERIALLERLALHKPDYIDVELAAWQRSAGARDRIAGAQRGNQLIISHHDLQATPADLATVFDALAATPADVLKAAFTARDATDSVRVLEQLRRRAAGRPLIALAMGAAGLSTRVLARKFGAWGTFSCLSTDEASAPGQPTIAELRGLYRWDTLGPETRVFGVVGWPVAHSQSPAIHNAALAAAGVDGVYLPWPVLPDYGAFAAFMDAVSGAAAAVVMGLSVTLPHKESALRWLDEKGHAVMPRARRCGAVNTLTRGPDGTWEGDNTDGLGARAALDAARAGLSRGRAVAVLGAGGVARAVVAELVDAGCAVTLYNRSAERAAHLAHELRCAWQPWDARVRYVGEILINCTSVGLWPATNDTPLPDDCLRAGTLVMDTVYRPAETRLLRVARAHGCQVIDGVEMFIRQAAAQFERWQARPCPLAVLRSALPSMNAESDVKS